MEIKITKLHENAVIPKKTDGDLGFDLHIIRDADWYFGMSGEKWYYSLQPHQQKLFHTGIITELPKGYGFLLRDRSGLAAKHGIHILAGVVDNSYAGEIMISAINLSDSCYDFNEGDRIAQGIVIPEYSLEFTETHYVRETSRGSKGFGSSGR